MNGLYTFAAILIGILILVVLISRKPKHGTKRVYQAEATWTPQAPAAQAPLPDPIRAAPITYQSMTVGVWLPVVQALVTGIILGVAAFVLAILAGSGALIALRWMGGVFVISTCIIWLSRYIHWTKAVQFMELMFHRDLDHDTYIGAPVPVIDVLLHHHDASGNRTDTSRRSYSASQEQMQDLSIGILRFNKPFSEKVWSGRGRSFSQNGLKRLREELTKDGLVASAGKGPNASYEFTQDGLDMLAAFLPEDSPLPHQAGRVSVLDGPSSTQARTQA